MMSSTLGLDRGGQLDRYSNLTFFPFQLTNTFFFFMLLNHAESEDLCSAICRGLGICRASRRVHDCS